MTCIFVKGDLLKSNLGAIAHGCNCLGVMGSGIALQFKKKYPEMYENYRELCLDKKINPGQVYYWKDEETGQHVFNLMTQYAYGRDKAHAKIEYIEKAVEIMLVFATQENISHIGIPAIGSGLGGLNWSDVKSSIEKVSLMYPKILLVVFEEYVP